MSKAQKSELHIIQVQKQIAEQRKYDTRCKEMCNMRRRAARVSLFKRMHMEAVEAEIEANINKARYSWQWQQTLAHYRLDVGAIIINQ